MRHSVDLRRSITILQSWMYCVRCRGKRARLPMTAFCVLSTGCRIAFFWMSGYCCNQNCRYCWTTKTDTFKTLDYIDRCLDVAVSLDLRKPMLIGGEPLLYKPFDELIRLFKSHGMERFGVNTNGTRLADGAFFRPPMRARHVLLPDLLRLSRRRHSERSGEKSESFRPA